MNFVDDIKRMNFSSMTESFHVFAVSVDLESQMVYI
jgi:hypothetical protein